MMVVLLALVAIPLYLRYLFRNRGTAANVRAGLHDNRTSTWS
ncbi:hypothetical protein [Streptomyces adustus]|nr:hypothetical protein [Streptomyces adustus]